MSLFSEGEIDYLHKHRIGRLATTGAAGHPHVVPVGFRLDDGVLKIGHHSLEGRKQNRLYLRHLKENPRAAIVVDEVDISHGWKPSGILIKGEARLHDSGGEALGPGFGPAWLEVVPDYASSWGLTPRPTSRLLLVRHRAPVRLAVLGASGPTGRLVVSGALERGHVVTAAARHLDAMPDSDQLTVMSTDVRDVDAVRAAVRGHDAVISAVGGRARHSGAVYSTAGRNLVEALQAERVPRLVVVSSGGVRSDDRGLPLWFRLAIPLVFRTMYDDMAEMEKIVRASPLDWTIVRASYLVDKPARGKFRIGDGANPAKGRMISRADLAGFLLDQLQDQRWLHAIPTVAY